MRKYQLAWVGMPLTGDIQLGSTDPELVTWFLDELKKVAPDFEYTKDSIDKSYDLEGRQTFCMVLAMNGKDTQINYWLMQQLLQAGWEPFSTQDDLVYLRRETGGE